MTWRDRLRDLFDWRWWARTECRRLVCVEPLMEDGERVGVAVHICDRRRFHLGPCRARS